MEKVRQKDSMKHGLLKRYLLDGDTLGQLAERYHVHPLTIRNWLHSIFNKIPPPQANLDPTMSCWLITDATHFKHWGCLLVTKATTTKHPLAISFHCREDYLSVVDHLEPISDLLVHGYTTDGKKGLVAAYKQVFPLAIQQRCLVHVRMRVQTLLTSQPKLLVSQELLELTKKLCFIKDAIKATDWWEQFSNWYSVNLSVINQRSYKGKSWWYTHSNLRKATKHILNASDNLFVFINQPNSISHTNHLEGLFGQRKPALVRHRGLSRKRIANALLWTFYLLSKQSSLPTVFYY